MTGGGAAPVYRAAVVGAGDIAAGRHLPALAEHAGRVRVESIVDVDTGRAAGLAREWGVPHHYGDVPAMLRARRPDLVVVCTPPGQHLPVVQAGLAAGAWVWCEKPPTLSLADYDRAGAGERTGGPYVSYVFQHRFGSAARHARQLIASAALGRPLVGVCHTLWFRDQAYFDVPWRGRWETEGGGPTMGHGIHQFDLMLYLLGDWTEVRAVARRLDRDVAAEDVSAALLTMASGALVSVVNSVLSPREESYLRVDLQQATVEVSHVYGYRNDDWRLTPRPGAAAGVRWPPERDVPGSHTAQLSTLLDAMDGRVRPEVSGPDGRRSLELAAAIYQSAATDRTVRRAELVPGNPFYRAMNGGEPAPGWLTAPVPHPGRQP
jgi:predicted dehydrogenase